MADRQRLRRLAETNLAKATYAREQLAEAGFDPVFDGPWFNEFVVRLPGDADAVVRRCGEHGVVPGVPLGWFYEGRRDQLLVCVTEVHRRDDIDRLIRTLSEATG